MLILLAFVPAAFGTARLVELAGDADVTPANARFLARPLPVVLHILAVVPYSILGALQFAPAFRRRHTAGIVRPGACSPRSGCWARSRVCGWRRSIPGPRATDRSCTVERMVFGTAMAASIVLGLRAIRRRDFVSHGAWMTRAYAIGLGAGTQVLTHLPWALLVGGRPGELPRAVMMGAGWVINVVAAEWIIRRRRARRRPVARADHPALAPAPVQATT
jgi:hypothetical protein